MRIQLSTRGRKLAVVVDRAVSYSAPRDACVTGKSFWIFYGSRDFFD